MSTTPSAVVVRAEPKALVTSGRVTTADGSTTWLLVRRPDGSHELRAAEVAPAVVAAPVAAALVAPATDVGQGGDDDDDDDDDDDMFHHIMS
jgi:hypothetical protein